MTIGLLLVWSGLGVALSIKTMLLSWHNCFVGKKKERRHGMLLLFVCSGLFRKREKKEH